MKPGRPKTEAEIRELVVRSAKENSCGCTRILGELKRLGVRTIARNTVKNILKAEGLDPGPKRGEGTWDEFVKRHAQTLWACDCLSKKNWTMGGVVEMFILFFINVGTRRVHVVGTTAHPDAEWMTQQARNVAMLFADEPVKPRFLIRDNDGNFVQTFDRILRDEGVEILRIPPRSPNMNPHAERFVGSIRPEALDHFIVLGEDNLRYIVS